MKTVLLAAALSATSALASSGSPKLSVRQPAILPCSEQGQKPCGNGCIDLGWTCCADQQGGCPPQEYCMVGSNDEYGCCPRGETCGGPGGVSTGPGDTITSTIWESQTTTFSATLPITTLTSAPTSSGNETSVPPAPWPTPVPTNGTTPSPVPTGAAAVKDAASGLLGVAMGAIALLF